MSCFRITLWAFLLAWTGLTGCAQNREGKSAGDVVMQPDKYYSVTKVVDGDTFWTDDGSPRGLKIRLIGIDAPETRETGRKKPGYYGEEAKEYLTRLLDGKKVRLEFDIGRRDKYGRTLAYVYLPDGVFVNAELIRRGFATVLTVPPNVKYAGLFVKLQQKARKKRRGLWSGSPRRQ